MDQRIAPQAPLSALAPLSPESPLNPLDASEHTLGAAAHSPSAGSPDPAAADAPNTAGVWYASYPPDVPHNIDVTQYQSVLHFFDDCKILRRALGDEELAKLGTLRNAS